MNTTKKILIGLGVLVLISGIAIWQIFSNLDSIVAGLIENVGTDVVGTDVRVSKVALELKAGKAAISGLTIKNPKGYKNKYIFAMDDIAVDLDTSTLTKNPIVINEILVRQPQVFYELDKKNVSNMDTLQKNMKSNESEQKEPDQTKSDSEEIKLIIKKFRFDGGNLSVSSAATPDKELDQKLPAISMNNLGAAKGGATGKEIASEIMKKLVSQVVKSALKAGVNKAIEEKKANILDKAGGKVKGLFD